MRPIDADALVSDIESARNMLFHSPYERRFHEDRIEFALDMVEDVPTLDYAPVVHGEWKYFHKQNIAVCTVCSFERDLDADFGRAVSCPNCGAKMDGGKDDG